MKTVNTRRELLKLAPLAAAAFFVPTSRDALVRWGLDWTDSVSAGVFSQTRLAKAFPDAEVTPFDKFPYNTYGTAEPDIDLDGWSLLVEGDVARPGKYSLDEIRSLPKQAQNVSHICVEGWSVVGSFGGARMSDFLDMVGSDPAARFLEVTCHDDYYTSYDMAGCRHPQTLLCYEMYGRPLDRGHGAPLRVHMPTKLGYKSAKYLFSLKVTNILSAHRGFWEDQGYSWHGGI